MSDGSLLSPLGEPPKLTLEVGLAGRGQIWPEKVRARSEFGWETTQNLGEFVRTPDRPPNQISGVLRLVLRPHLPRRGHAASFTILIIATNTFIHDNFNEKSAPTHPFEKATPQAWLKGCSRPLPLTSPITSPIMSSRRSHIRENFATAMRRQEGSTIRSTPAITQHVESSSGSIHGPSHPAFDRLEEVEAAQVKEVSKPSSRFKV